MQEKGERMVVEGMHVRIHALQNAGSRTKNRLSERGKSGFIIKEIRKSVRCFDGLSGIMVMSVFDAESGRAPWLGWLPSEEIDVVLWKD